MASMFTRLVIWAGMVPLRELLFKYKSHMSVICPNSLGMVPVKLLPESMLYMFENKKKCSSRKEKRQKKDKKDIQGLQSSQRSYYSRNGSAKIVVGEVN